MSERRLPHPDFIIIGAMKCATSTLHEQLARQPGIFMTTPKEPCYFSDDDNWARGRAWYQSLFDAAVPGDLCGESSTHYTKLPTHPETVARMAGALPHHTRFIYIMRHPVDRLISQYIHEWTQRLVGDSIDEAVDAFPPLTEYSRYAMQMTPFLEHFGADRVLPVFFERLTTHPQEQLERVAAFLGYDRPVTWHDAGDAENISSERIRKSPVRRFIASVPGLRSLLHAVLSDSARDKLKSQWRMDRRPELSPERIALLERTFDDDLRQLTPWLAPQIDEPSVLPLRCVTFKEVASTQSMDRQPCGEAVT